MKTLGAIVAGDKNEELTQEDNEPEEVAQDDGRPKRESIPVKFQEEDYEDVRQLPCTD